MKGLLRNNLYMTLTGIKLFAGMIVVLGIFVAAVVSQPLLVGYSILCMVGFPLVSLSNLSKENTSQWSKYKLTAPVCRVDIIKSYFFSQFIWLFTGIVASLTVMWISVILHGFPFDRIQDAWMIVTLGMSISLLMNAVFFPLYYFGNEEKNEILILISLLCAIGIVMGLSSLINWLFGENMTNLQLLAGMAVLLLCAAGGLCVSFPLTIYAFQRKEY